MNSIVDCMTSKTVRRNADNLFIRTGSLQQVTKTNTAEIQLKDRHLIATELSVKCLGAVIDCNLTFGAHQTRRAASCFWQIRISCAEYDDH